MPRSFSRPPVSVGSRPPLRQAAPERWDRPFSEEMTDQDVDRLLAHPLFSSIQHTRFPVTMPLRGILKNDAALRHYQRGEIIVRQGDYGHSAFLILEGRVLVCIDEPGPEQLGRRQRVRPSLWGSFTRWLRQPRYGEQALPGGVRTAGEAEQLQAGARQRIFLQDVPGVLEANRTVRLGPGELFGELAALGRTPRTSTILTDQDALLLEIRWQGLRDIRKFSAEWKQLIDQRYRERSLIVHLQETPLFRSLPEATLRLIADATRFEVFGEFEWQHAYQRTRAASDRERLEQEPLIARQGELPGGLLLIRSGFARVSAHYNHGERTETYLGKGDAFGLEESIARWRGHPEPLRRSLRALGYVDALFIPAAVLEEHVFPRLAPAELARFEQPADRPATAQPWQGTTTTNAFLEFLVAQRFINGRATMLIDLDRCTRCDDCVRACAATHDNNPRFIRNGPEAAGVMVASACMHCVDPVCMIGCPTGAIHRASLDGQVEINPVTCIGCSVCAQSCPYGTIQMVALRDEDGLPVVAEDTGAPIRRATKCDLCTDQPAGPACVRACAHDALVRADMRAVDALNRWLQR
ncbi:MAG TPA: cyclic nucleotide-binding domain-containing protein [Lacunisphaera sp.]|nr:cyclic nucleotide-binding domain-containing protein [Lacunisphaera sp.]